jgi:hypothetical protein
MVVVLTKLLFLVDRHKLILYNITTSLHQLEYGVVDLVISRVKQ